MKAILHCDSKWGIGKKNDLMFELPQDMAFFRKTTLGNAVIMGSNTLLSFPGGKPLKNRLNIVLWPGGDKNRAAEMGYEMYETLEEFFNRIKTIKDREVFVIGGAMMYKTMLPYCDEVLLTKVDADGKAEVFFPNLDELENWELVEESAPVIDNGYSIRFCTYKNNKKEEL